MDKRDALQKAYDGGLLAGKAEFVIEGVGERSTNWGRGMTVIVKGATASQAEDAIRRFGFIDNGDSRNNRHSHGKTVYLTTFAEGETLAGAIGMFETIDGIASGIPPNERHTVSLVDHSLTMLIAVCDQIMRDVEGVSDQDKTAFETLLINAFQQGMRGLSLGSSDLDALMAGEGILDRYDGRHSA